MNATDQVDTANCLGGWCMVGSTVYSNFYNGEAEEPRTVEKISVYGGEHKGGRVWTKGSPVVKPLDGVDFQTWITQSPK